MKKWICCILSMILLLSLLTACGEPQKGELDSVGKVDTSTDSAGTDTQGTTEPDVSDSTAGDEGSVSEKCYLYFSKNTDETAYIVAGIDDGYEPIVVIPATVGDKPVTTISDSAFDDKTGIQQIILTENIKHLYFGCFEGCTSLQYNVYDNAKYLGTETNPYYALIMPTDSSITSCEIHPDTQVIADRAFWKCENLTAIVLPEGVYVALEAFAYCYSLSSVTFPVGSCTLGEGVFSSCGFTGDFVFPDYITEIPVEILYNCDDLSSVTLGAGVTSIGRDAFGASTWMTQVNFAGTLAMWEAIEKGTDWVMYDGTVIQCSDGETTAR